MRRVAVQRILGLLLTLFSITMVLPIVVSLIYDDGAWKAFLWALFLILGSGALLALPVRKARVELRIRDGFIVVLLFWVVLSGTGAVPFLLAEQPRLSLTDAVFESVSGLTTTGATVITGLDGLPPSILFYRQLLQWLGGMGIIVLAVAILPLLGIGGMQLYRAETPGPMKDTKLTPRIRETAKALWNIYLALTVASATAFWLAGMSVFDAIAHSFSTVSIGGFSTRDASIGYFDSPIIEAITVVFMTLSGINFALHFLVWRALAVTPRAYVRDAKLKTYLRKLLLDLRGLAMTPRAYFRDAEFKTYLYILLGISIVTSLSLVVAGTFDDAGTALRHGIFQAVSIATTTGFTTTSYSAWPTFLPVLLLFSSFVGGCAGSTGGGLKVIRVLLLFKQGAREILRLIHPSARVAIKIGESVLPDRVVEAVWGFFAGYVLVFSIMLLALMATGLDQVTAFSAVAASLNNLGPGLGDVAYNYGAIGDTAKWILAAAMLLGRLEIFTLLVILSPAFWRS